ncbi:hypothetical protein AN641_10070 [Candidatus Epulonipiscioides gigas]|nr:hypothetical protein AN641_10070 [Epulopiscium sp. SCG-C07WGA-EpuloA2]
MILLFSIFTVVFFIQNIMFLNQIVSKILLFKINKNYIYLVALLNVVASIIWIQILPNSIFCAYLFLSLFYIVEIILCYEGLLLSKIAIALTIIVHLLCIATIIISMLSLLTNITMYDIVHTIEFLLITRIITSLICIIIMCLLLKLVPITMRQKSAEDNKTKIFLALEVTAIICVIASLSIYEIEIPIKEHAIQQFMLGISWIIVEYIAIFMVIGFQVLKDNKIYLENRLQLDNIYKNVLIEKSDVTIQVDCKTGIILNHILNGVISENLIGLSYTKVICDLTKKQIHPDDQSNVLKLSNLFYMLNEFKKYNVHQYSFEYRLCEKVEIGYEWFKVDVTITEEITQEKNELNKIIALLIINNIQKEKDLIFKAERDALSKLYNKATTQKLIQNHLNKCKIGVLFMIDVDNFKNVNDNLGHEKGDCVIEDVAQELTYIFDENDIVGRMGGDEFMVFIKANISEFDIHLYATKICKAINKTYSNNNINVTISASIGITKVNENIKIFSELYLLADKAMYHSKKGGKNTFTIYNPAV